MPLQNIITSALILILVTGGGYLVYSKSHTQSATLTNQSAQAATTTDVATPEIMAAIKKAESEQPARIGKTPTAAEINASPYIKHIRIALNEYLAGTNAGIEGPALGDASDPKCGLTNFDKSYYKSKFVIIEAEDNDYGGVTAYIVFVNKPDSIFWTWVYQLGGDGGEYSLRGFCRTGPPDDKKVEFKTYMDGILKDPTYHLF